MKYSRNKINQVGKVIASEQSDALDYAESIMIVDNWRNDHLPVLADLFGQVDTLFKKNGVSVVFSSQRLKRMTSIQAKLRHNPEMGLGGVQDIGGARFVFSDMNTLELAARILCQNTLTGLSLEKEPYDYVRAPKNSGYRSIHFVYKYSSDNESLNGKRVELQLRTKLQHDWATAVETAEFVSKSPLKAGIGDESWLVFFQLVSAIFAIKEDQNVNPMFSDYTERDYCIRFAELDNKYKFLDQLRGLIGAVRVAESSTFSGGYVLLLVNFLNKTVSLRHFTEQNKAAANALYAQVESGLDREQGAVVLVSVQDLNELLSAYPSYFMNAREFIDALADFTATCRLHGYLN